jgi:hypothetical protein
MFTDPERVTPGAAIARSATASDKTKTTKAFEKLNATDRVLREQTSPEYPYFDESNFSRKDLINGPSFVFSGEAKTLLVLHK